MSVNQRVVQKVWGRLDELNGRLAPQGPPCRPRREPTTRQEPATERTSQFHDALTLASAGRSRRPEPPRGRPARNQRPASSSRRQPSMIRPSIVSWMVGSGNSVSGYTVNSPSSSQVMTW